MKRTQGTPVVGTLVTIDLNQLVVDVHGSLVTVRLTEVESIQLVPAPAVPPAVSSPSSVSSASAAASTLPPDFTVWVIDKDTLRFPAGTYHTQDCMSLVGHTARPVRYADLPQKPKPVPDRCVERLLSLQKGKGALSPAELVRESAKAPVPPRPEAPSGVTAEGYSRLWTGMSRSLADAVIGFAGEEVSRTEIGGTSTAAYRWTTASGANILAIFTDDKLVSKSQSGLR